MCSVSFEPEPGFYFGAMFVSYGMVAGIFLSEWLLFYLLGYGRSEIVIYVVPLSVLFLLPFIFRYSRIFYLYLFGGIKFDKDISKESKTP